MTEIGVPTMTYEEVEADIAARGLEARDLLGQDGHFDAWRRRKRLPAKDASGTHWLSSKDYFQRYEAAPDGAAACPPHADLWHYLLKVGEPLGWTEAPGFRAKTVPICDAMLVEPEDFTDERMAEGRTRLEAQAGEPMPDHVWETFARGIRRTPAADRRCVQVVRDLLERHGVAHPAFGRIVRVTLTVEC